MYIIIERDELIRQYMGYTQLEIVVSLNSLKHHGINVSGRTLQRILCRIGLHRRKNPSDLRLVRNFVEAQLQKSGAYYGYHFMHCKLLQAGFIVSREIVRGLPHELEPEGVQLHKKRRLVRRKYSGHGPNFIWHIDGYDKLKLFGIEISGCINGFSRKITWLEANNTTNNFFVTAVSNFGGCPLCIRTDKGTENGHVACFQKLLIEE